MTIRQQAGCFILGGWLLSLGTPAFLGLTQPGVRFYMLQPYLFAAQSVPFLLAAGLWLPWRSADAIRIGRVLACVLFGFSVVLHIPYLVGLLSVGGDMGALGFLVIATGFVVAILIVTPMAFGRWMRLTRRRPES